MLEMCTACPATSYRSQVAARRKLRIDLFAFQKVTHKNQTPTRIRPARLTNVPRVRFRYLTPADWQTIRFLSFAMAFDEIDMLAETAEPLLSKPAQEWRALALGLYHPSNRYLLLEQHDQPIGATYFRQCNALSAEIGDVWVAPSARRQGFARTLMTLALRDLEKRRLTTARLWVAEHNTSACALYQQLGFAPSGTQVRSATDTFSYHELSFPLTNVNRTPYIDCLDATLPASKVSAAGV